MAKKKNTLAGIIFTIFILLLAAILILPLFIDNALKAVVQKQASKQLGVDVSIEKIHLNIASGQLTISGMEINNPEGYEYRKLMTAGKIVIKTDIKSLITDTVRINNIDVKDVNVVMEQKGLSSNLNDVIKSMPKSQDSSGTKAVDVALVDITNIDVTAKLLPVPGKSDSIKFNIAKLQLKDIGSGKSISIADLVGQIISGIAESIAKDGAGMLPADMLGGINESLKAVGEVGKEIEKAAEQIKGLFSPKKE